MVTLEIFDYVAQPKYVSAIESEFKKAIEELPEYSDAVHKLGIFISHKFDIEIKKKSIQEWNQKYGYILKRT